MRAEFGHRLAVALSMANSSAGGGGGGAGAGGVGWKENVSQETYDGKIHLFPSLGAHGLGLSGASSALIPVNTALAALVLRLHDLSWGLDYFVLPPQGSTEQQ